MYIQNEQYMKSMTHANHVLQNNLQNSSANAVSQDSRQERNAIYHSMMAANAQDDDLICSSKSWFGSQNGH